MIEKFFGVTKLSESDVENQGDKLVQLKTRSGLFRLGRLVKGGYFVFKIGGSEIFEFPCFDTAKAFVHSIS